MSATATPDAYGYPPRRERLRHKPQELGVHRRACPVRQDERLWRVWWTVAEEVDCQSGLES